jgi:hypothetical protein
MEAALKAAAGDRLAWNDHVLPWRFTPTGTLEVNGRDTESHIGELFWEDSNFVTGPAFQVRDWVFCLAQFPKADQKWILCAFCGNNFFAYREFAKTSSSDALRQQFVALTVGLFWPILHPETFDGVEGDHYAAAREGEITFSTKLGPGGLLKLMSYARSGGIKGTKAS